MSTFENFDNLKRKVEAETNSFNIPTFSFEEYKKTPQEKEEVKKARAIWKQAMFKSHGFNYRKHNNP